MVKRGQTVGIVIAGVIISLWTALAFVIVITDKSDLFLSDKEVKEYSQKCAELGGTASVLVWKTDENIGRAHTVYCEGI